jgi:hypothetical protein
LKKGELPCTPINNKTVTKMTKGQQFWTFRVYS